MMIKMAWRNIWRNGKRSMIIMLSIAIGLFCGIMVLAIYKGMMSSRVDTVINSELGNLQVHARNFKDDFDPAYSISESAAVIKKIQLLQSVKAFSTRSIAQGMLSTTTGSAGVIINGIDPEEESEVSNFSAKIIEGQSPYFKKMNSIVIGKKLAKKMKLSVGKKLVLTFTDTASSLVNAAFRVSGIYQTDNAPFDEQNVYIAKSLMSGLLGSVGSIHEIALLLHTDDSTGSVQQQLISEFPDYEIESWRQLSPETELLVNTIDVYAYIIIGIILFALSFGIINTMLMAVLERTREIGMMMALGLNKSRLFLLIVLETIFLTLGGVPIGFLAAWLTSSYYSIHGMDWSEMGEEMMSSFGFSTILYPEFPTERILPVLLIVMITAILSCMMPAYRAIRLQPVDALRR